jgi:hypothetical protein
MTIKWSDDGIAKDSSVDDVPLTEEERLNAERLLRSTMLVDSEPTRVVRLTDTDIEVLQHGLLLLKSVQDHRIMYLDENDERESILERNLTLRNIRQLYAWLENAKDQEPI